MRPRASAILVPSAFAVLLACGGVRPPSTPAPQRTATDDGASDVGPASYGREPSWAPSALEAAIFDELRSRRSGRPPLRASPALSVAARELARAAAAAAADPLAPTRLRIALARGAAFDPAPRAFRVEGPASMDARSLAVSIHPSASETHAGVGAAPAGDRVHVVVLLSTRLAEIEPFPRESRLDEIATLRGRLPTLERPSVHVTTPSGESRTVPTRVERNRFAAPIRFDAPGRWLIELVGEGDHGPEVAALLTVACGDASLSGPTIDDPPDPPDPAQAAARVLHALNATRARQRLAPLHWDPALSDVARQHSEAMLRAGIVAHRLDGSDGPAERLRRAHVPFALVLENVARGPSALAAHRLAEESPAHRQNILSPEATRIGIGIARDERPGRDGAVYLTELFTARPAGAEDDRLTPEARVREVLWRERARRGAPPLVSDPRLEELARSAVREMVRRGEPDPGDLPDRALAIGRTIAAADALVAASALDAARSRNVGDVRFNRVGVGVAVGDVARYGAGLLWIAVIYTD